MRPKPTYTPKKRRQQHGRRAERRLRTHRLPLGERHGQRNKLTPHREDLREWFRAELPYSEILDRLKKRKVASSISAISHYRQKLWREELQETVLTRIATGAAARDQVRKELGNHGTADVDTLIALIQNLIFILSTQSRSVLSVGDITKLLRPVLEWSRLKLKERDTAVAERKVALLEEQARKAREAEGVARDATLTAEQKEERMRQIFSLPSQSPGK